MVERSWRTSERELCRTPFSGKHAKSFSWDTQAFFLDAQASFQDAQTNALIHYKALYSITKSPQTATVYAQDVCHTRCRIGVPTIWFVAFSNHDLSKNAIFSTQNRDFQDFDGNTITFDGITIKISIFVLGEVKFQNFDMLIFGICPESPGTSFIKRTADSGRKTRASVRRSMCLDFLTAAGKITVGWMSACWVYRCLVVHLCFRS